MFLQTKAIVRCYKFGNSRFDPRKRPMAASSELILLGGLLLLLSVFAGAVSARLGAPLLLAFLGLGMLAGEDGPGHIRFDDFRLSYLIGSAALAVILFDG